MITAERMRVSRPVQSPLGVEIPSESANVHAPRHSKSAKRDRVRDSRRGALLALILRATHGRGRFVVVMRGLGSERFVRVLSPSGAELVIAGKRTLRAIESLGLVSPAGPGLHGEAWEVTDEGRAVARVRQGTAA